MLQWSATDQANAGKENWGLWLVIDERKPKRAYWRAMPVGTKLNQAAYRNLFVLLQSRASRGIELHKRALALINPSNNP